MSETKDRNERQALRQARQAKRAARAKKSEVSPEERKRARMKRRAERAQEAAGRVRRALGKPDDTAGASRVVEAGKNPEERMQSYGDTMLTVLGSSARGNFPDRLDNNCREGVLFPDFTPKFKLNLGAGNKVFMIGSGFARHLEPALAERGVILPTTVINVPDSDIGRAENPLNEYTPGTIAQRIIDAFRPRPIPKGTVIAAGQIFSDQLMPGQFNATMETIESRRKELARIYARLQDCSAVIITLASAESWYDARSRRFFNRPPPASIIRSRSRHIFFALQDVEDVVGLLAKPLALLGGAGIKVVLVVSPDAQRVTFSGTDAVCANEISKAVLRVAAHRLNQKFDHVDYFPALEIARSAGLHAYMDDNVQLRDEFSALLVASFIKAYTA
jgi:hypothetical protein